MLRQGGLIVPRRRRVTERGRDASKTVGAADRSVRLTGWTRPVKEEYLSDMRTNVRYLGVVLFEVDFGEETS